MLVYAWTPADRFLTNILMPFEVGVIIIQPQFQKAKTSAFIFSQIFQWISILPQPVVMVMTHS